MNAIRSLLTFTAAMAATALLPAQQTPDEALHALQAGNRRFANDRSVPQPIGEGVRRTLARGQSPIAVVVTCADSRVPPEHVFNTGLGEIVVVRTAGHIASAETVAAIEHAVETLQVPLCVVLGHEHCDVVAAAIDNAGHQHPNHRHSATVLSMLERVEPAVRKALARELGGNELRKASEEEHAQATALECLRRSPLLRRYEAVGKFRMVAARYHQSGDVEWLPRRELPPEPEANHPEPIAAIPMGLPPHVALSLLRSGHRRFLGDHRPMQDLSKTRREQLSENQQPLAIVVTDTDSRVSPEHVFDAGLGELYVVRVAGCALTDEALASIEFAASKLGASLLVVMGHNRCESIRSAVDHPERQQLTPNQRALLQRLEPAVTAARHDHEGDVADKAGQLQVLRTINETCSRSTLLRSLEDKGRFALLPVFYDVASGDLHWLKGQAPAASHAVAHDEHEKHAHAHEGEHVAEHAGDHGDHGTHDHGAHEHAHLPVVDFMAAPMGEVAPLSSHDAHGSHDSHAHDEAHGDHAADDAHDVAGHGSHDPHDSHGAHDPHDAHEPATHAHDDHGDRHESAHAGFLQHLQNPIVLLGGIAVLSLLLAAAISLKSR